MAQSWPWDSQIAVKKKNKIKKKNKFERRPLIFVKLSFGELRDSKLSGLHKSYIHHDNMAIIH